MDVPPTTTRATLLTRRVLIIAAVVLVAVGLVLKAMGREFLSDSGFGIATGARTPNTSQWLVDPYSSSHVLHGVLFYALLFPLARWLLPGVRWILAEVLESSWELLENSPLIIDRYRANTASLDYYGDSILNSLCDILCALCGFWLAWRLGWKWMVALVLASELLMLYFVRDNLTLNVLMLVWPSEAIKQWQLQV